MLDMLELNGADPVVINTLIDACRIENILLIETTAEVRQVMARDPPRNVSRVRRRVKTFQLAGLKYVS